MESTLGERIRAVRRKRLNARGRPTTLAEFGALVAAAERELEGERGRPPRLYTHGTVSRWEADKRRPKEGTLAAIAVVGGIAVDALVHGRPTGAAQRDSPSDGPTREVWAAAAEAAGMTPRLVLWRETFRVELARAGASEEEIDAISWWLARPVWARAGGSSELAVPDETLVELWERMAAAARWILAHRGRRFRAKLTPPVETLVPDRPAETPLWEVLREVEFRAFSHPALLESLLETRAFGARRRRGPT